MRSHCLIYRLTRLSVVVALCQAASAAGSTDLAKVMPSDTAFYIGWSQCVEKGSPELRAEKQLAKSALGLLAEYFGEERAAQMTPLLELIEPLETGSVGIGLFDVQVVDEEADIHAALVVDAGDDSAKFVEAVRKLAAMAGVADQIEEHTVKGVALARLQLGDSPMHLLWGLHRGHFLLALGDTAAGKVIDCMNGDAESLADTAELKLDRRKVNANLEGCFFCLYVDAQRVIKRAKEIAEELAGPLPPIVEPALEQLGLTAVRSKYLHYDESGGKPRLMGFAHLEGPMRGFLKLCDQETLTEDDLKILPKDAYWAEVGNLNLAGLWEETIRIIGELAPDALPMVEGPLAKSTQMLGFSITDDLLPAFGDTWAMFDAPDHGGILLTGTVLVAEVPDAEKLQRILTQVVEFLSALLTQEDLMLALKQAKHGEHTIHYVLIGGAPSPVAPAWGFVDGRWVLGLFPQTVAVALQQVDPKTRSESILDHPDVKAARAVLPKEVQAFCYYNSKYLTRLMYPFLNALQTLGVSMLGKHGAEIDLEVMPPVSVAAAKSTNYVATCSKDADGILYASVGDGAPLALVAAGTVGLTTSVMLPSLSRARTVAKRAVSASNLKGIGQGCHIYANENKDKFPDSLDQLIEDGTITRKVLQSPFDPEGTISYLYVAGQTESDDVRNVLAYERVRDDEGTNVLFIDGHVEFMPLGRFKEVLRETYRRLDREDEIPEAFRD